METYNYNDFKEAGIDCQFVQDNQSASKKGVLRGLHFQINHPQDKLVRVVNGEVFDVAGFKKKALRTFRKMVCIVLSHRNKNSSLYQRILHMDSSCCLIMQSSAIRLQISIIQMMRAVFSGMILQSKVEWHENAEGMTQADLILSDKDKVHGGFDAYCRERGIVR